MGLHNQFGSLLGAGEEGTWGTAATRTAGIDCTSIVCQIQAARVLATEMHQGATAYMASRVYREGRKEASVSVSAPVLYEGTGILLKAGLGSVSTQADTPTSGRHTHTYTLGDLPSLTLEDFLGQNIGGTNQSQVMEGCVCNTFSLVFEPHNRARGTWNFIAQDRSAAPGNAPSAPTIASGNYVEHTDCAAAGFGWNSGTHTFQRVTLNVNHNTTRRDGYGTDTTLQPYAGGGGPRQVTIEVEREYTGDTFQAAYLAGTQSDFTLAHESGDDQFNLTLYNAVITDYTPPSQSAPAGYMTERFTLTGLANAGASETGLAIVVENSQATAIEP